MMIKPPGFKGGNGPFNDFAAVLETFSMKDLRQLSHIKAPFNIFFEIVSTLEIDSILQI